MFDHIRRQERVGVLAEDRHRTGKRVDRRNARREMIKRRRERIKVASRIGPGSLYLLERSVIPRVAKNALSRRLMVRVRRIALRQPKIEQNDLSSCVQLEVLRLDVAVNDRIVLIMQK